MRIQHQPHRKRENFPVAAWFLPAKSRETILIFYDFVRGLDEIADEAAQPPEQRAASLLAIRNALEAGHNASLPPWAQSYQRACAKGRMAPRFGEQMWQAFHQDTQKHRYESWHELLQYCTLSAVPVGRFMLWAANESHADLAACDALCQTLQILNHLRDAKQDFLSLSRCYLPGSELRESQLDDTVWQCAQMPPALRALYTQWLDRCEKLLHQSDHLPASVQSIRLRWQIQLTRWYARAWLHALRRRDALQMRVNPRWRDLLSTLRLPRVGG